LPLLPSICFSNITIFVVAIYRHAFRLETSFSKHIEHQRPLLERAALTCGTILASEKHCNCCKRRTMIATVMAEIIRPLLGIVTLSGK